MGNVLEGKVAVVTGSGQGIGRAIAVGLAKEGAKLVTNNRRPGSTGFAILNETEVEKYSPEQKEFLKQQAAHAVGDAETTAREISANGGEAVPFFGDVSDFKVAGELIQTAIKAFGKIDILVNVAGSFQFSPVWEMSEETWDHVTLSKPKSYFNTIRHATPYMMKQKWGRIINTSALAFLGMVNHCNYSAANAGVVGLTRGVAKELFQYGITCNAYSPYAMTRAGFEVVALLREKAGTGESTPLPTAAADRFMSFPEPESINPLIVYLASDAASSVTGSVFHIRGGNIGLYSEPEIIRTIDKADGWWTVEELMKQMPGVLLEGYRNIVEKG
ncbi:MAG: SDR family oxidoreductase [Dehalococcoidales bacterium]|nr:SDR family oxidoreductase [Dehalococcoidales bacterium]